MPCPLPSNQSIYVEYFYHLIPFGSTMIINPFFWVCQEVEFFPPSSLIKQKNICQEYLFLKLHVHIVMFIFSDMIYLLTLQLHFNKINADL